MKLPEKISPCPIVESIVEMRFNTTLPLDAVFGMVFTAVRDRFPTVENLPILQLPEAIRDQDPNLRYKPHYRLKGDTFLLNVGPRVVSVINPGEYAGWEKFFTEIKEVVLRFEPLSIADRILRLGVRYVNFFEDIDIYDKIKLRIDLDNEPFQSKQKTFRALMDKPPFTSSLQLVNNSQLSIEGYMRNGSVLDSDNFIEDECGIPMSKLQQLIDEGHSLEKRIFFELLEDDFLRSLKPIYKE